MEEEKKSPGVKRRRLFGAEDDKHLEEIISNKDFNGWKSVAKQMPGFSPKQLRDRWHNYISPKNKFGPWTEEEDSIILDVISKNGKHWDLLASMLPHRTTSQISAHWEKCLDPNITKGPFTPEEDQIIIDYVNSNGPLPFIPKEPSRFRESPAMPYIIATVSG